ncbi:unnamed protein product [Miscanthus lutarioriparius]|uniref:Uncharacterized protein n=1 Tax=Miscanthus lutarioriparius TaxID=422564 RepID=A0A811NFM9_9POAL|nr:unnamed protein product [Miscanthus lutarioriparius]
MAQTYRELFGYKTDATEEIEAISIWVHIQTHRMIRTVRLVHRHTINQKGTAGDKAMYNTSPANVHFNIDIHIPIRGPGPPARSINQKMALGMHL